jgi:hypothetical protein
MSGLFLKTKGVLWAQVFKKPMMSGLFLKFFCQSGAKSSHCSFSAVCMSWSRCVSGIERLGWPPRMAPSDGPIGDYGERSEHRHIPLMGRRDSDGPLGWPPRMAPSVKNEKWQNEKKTSDGPLGWPHRWKMKNDKMNTRQKKGKMKNDKLNEKVKKWKNEKMKKWKNEKMKKW